MQNTTRPNTMSSARTQALIGSSNCADLDFMREKNKVFLIGCRAHNASCGRRLIRTVGSKSPTASMRKPSSSPSTWPPASSSKSKLYPQPRLHLPNPTTLMSHKPKREFQLNEAHQKRNEEILKQVQNMRSNVSVEEALAQYDRIKKGSNRYES